MAKIAVIKTGGKQYLVKENQQISVDNLNQEAKSKIDLDVLALIDTEKDTVELGKPFLAQKLNAEVVENFKGDKIRVAKFKAKSRYRRVRGYRHHLSAIKIGKI